MIAGSNGQTYIAPTTYNYVGYPTVIPKTNVVSAGGGSIITPQSTVSGNFNLFSLVQSNPILFAVILVIVLAAAYFFLKGKFK